MIQVNHISVKPDYATDELEPCGKGECPRCGNNYHLWSDTYEDGEYKHQICMPCLANLDIQYVRDSLVDHTDAYVDSESVFFEFGYELYAYWEFKEEKVAASRDPNETKTVIQPTVKPGGTILYENQELCSIENKYFRKEAKKIAREYYQENRRR